MTQAATDHEAESLFLAIAWDTHPLGDRSLWPVSLRNQLRSLFASRESMYLVWGAGRTFFFNDAYLPVLGPRVSGAMGANFEELWADAYPAIEPPFLKTLAGEASRIVDLPVPMARWGVPEETWWTFSYTPVFDDDGVVAGVLCITNETTATVRQAEAQREAAGALEEAERRLRRAQEAGHIGLFTIDIASGALTGTPEFFRLFGIEPGPGIYAETIETLVVPDDAAIVSHADTRASQDIALKVEYRIRRPDTGEVRCIERRAEFEYDPAGAPLRLIGVVQDVTERRDDRDALAKLNAMLEATVVERTQALLLHEKIIQSDTTAICAFDTEHRLIAFNKAHNDEFFRVNGFYTRLGDVFWSLFVPEQRAVMKAQMDRALTGESFTVEEEFGNPAIDAPRWEILYSPLRDESGRIIGAFHHARDISARYRAQAELAEAQEALRQSQKMEAMGQLTGGVAHDFNNLLTPIVGTLDMLERKKLGSDREQLLIKGAVASAERARMLVQRLLAFARRQPLQSVAVDIPKLIDGMADLIASTTGPQIKVIASSEGNMPFANADPNQLEMALLNLAVNARDAMPDGGTLRITASVETVLAAGRDLKPGRYIRLSVADTGMGMNEETIARAVEPFFSTKGVGKGTGLGLSMVHGLASQLGGALRLISRPGLGTNVELWLPESRDMVQPATAATGVTLPASKGTALLVDDEDYVRLSTADMLSELGYEVIEAASAEAALTLVRRGIAPDILITDHLMPGMTGSDLARALRAEQPRLAVLIISGYAESEGVELDLPRLTKPFRRDELIASLSAIGA
ncbi:PAS domain-containing protein [Sphingomonas sp. BIUV-7]|uniref:histidine kinase n=1 Tax=Sphingomonas natans TaxID=3063330 RepID=A0ABT8Y9A0_9SPHN|nr:PAS domain-containing protein [Sphingomonas sp. BIUV-7]MDO6414921.1 PAS domain-containing protein [Sphingomonas sp. BIUV-7]